MPVLSRLRRDESGISLIEMLAAMSIGVVILFAVLGLMDTMVRSSAQSHGRMEGIRVGRTAIDRIGQELRLASCPDTGSAIISADADSVSYYVARPQSDFTLEPVVERHTLTFAPTAGEITLTVSPGAGEPPVWSATPSRREVLGANVGRIGTTPIFQYLGYDLPMAPATTAIAAPVSAADLPNVAQVRVSFNALPTFGDATQAGSRFESTIVLRTDDPTDTDNTPQC
jgi:hypothetical protein